MKFIGILASLLLISLVLGANRASARLADMHDYQQATYVSNYIWRAFDYCQVKYAGFSEEQNTTRYNCFVEYFSPVVTSETYFTIFLGGEYSSGPGAEGLAGFSITFAQNLGEVHSPAAYSMRQISQTEVPPGLINDSSRNPTAVYLVLDYTDIDFSLEPDHNTCVRYNSFKRFYVRVELCSAPTLKRVAKILYFSDNVTNFQAMSNCGPFIPLPLEALYLNNTC